MNNKKIIKLEILIIIITLISLIIPLLISNFIQIQDTIGLTKQDLIIFGIIPITIALSSSIIFLYLLVKFTKKYHKIGITFIIILISTLFMLYNLLEKNIFLLVTFSIFIFITSLNFLIRFIIKNKKLSFIILLFITLSFTFYNYNEQITNITGLVVEDIYNFITPNISEEESGIPTNETLFKLPIINETKPTEEKPPENITIPGNFTIPKENITNNPPTTEITTFYDNSKEKTIEVIK